MTKTQIIEHLKSKKDEFRQKYGITALGLDGSYAMDEANETYSTRVEPSLKFDINAISLSPELYTHHIALKV